MDAGIRVPGQGAGSGSGWSGWPGQVVPSPPLPWVPPLPSPCATWLPPAPSTAYSKRVVGLRKRRNKGPGDIRGTILLLVYLSSWSRQGPV